MHRDTDAMNEVLREGAPAPDRERMLADAAEAQRLLDGYAASLDWSREVDEVEDLFTIVKMLKGRFWLEALSDGRTFGPVTIPPEAGGVLALGWRLTAVLARSGREWRLLEVSEVRPL